MILEQGEKPCGRSKEYAAAYSHPGGYRTSMLLGRMMRGMNRCFDRGRHLHGSPAARRLQREPGRCWRTTPPGARPSRGEPLHDGQRKLVVK
jgi:hypothetical protein